MVGRKTTSKKKLLRAIFSEFLKLATGIIVDLKTILGDMRKGEAEFAEDVNPELRTTIEKAIGTFVLKT